MSRIRWFCPAAVVALLALMLPAAAAAAPITVQLRVEGSSKTWFEGPVSVEAPASPGITTPSSEGAHPCDVKDNGSNEGFGSSSPSPTAALYDAAKASGLPLDAKWSKTLNDFFVTKIGTDVETGSPNFEAWGYAVNYTTANVGGCQFQLAPGSEVLWGFNYFNLTHLLALSGPAAAAVGTPFTVHVTDGRTGEPIAGATIGNDVAGVTTPLPGSPSTNKEGNATITLSAAGTSLLKATQSESVRSNAINVCVHNGSDGTCGTTLTEATCASAACPAGHEPPRKSVPPEPVFDSAVAGGVEPGQTYSRRHAPRVLTGTITVPTGETLHDVRIGLTRRVGHRCWTFSGSRAAFARARCGRDALFSIGSGESFTYLLPARLPRGLYTYFVQGVDDAGHATTLVPGVNDVVFRVA